jgi:uncharacterized protein (TIGR03437 family)
MIPHRFTRLITLRIVIALAATAIVFPVSAALPVISSGGVINAASFQPGLASGAWISIKGSNLSTSTRLWQTSDFKGNQLPTALDSVTVTINGRSAYVYYISPSQINVLAPDDPATGSVPVQVTTSQGASNIVQANKQAAAPALFSYSQMGGYYAIAQDPRTYSLIAPVGLFGAATPTLPAVPGETLILYATGLGAVASGQPAGQLVPAPSTLTNSLKVTIGSQTASVQFAGLIGSGLYQLNLIVPDLPPGDASVVLSVAGVQSAGQSAIPVAAGTPASGQPNPGAAGCITGQVDYITWSLQWLYLDLPDELSIAGTKLCPSCAVKAPAYPEMMGTLETALSARKSAQACYDTNGSIFQVKVARP